MKTCDPDRPLAAVLLDPGADAPRLAYADWLDGRGERARAEFIRLECAAAALERGRRAGVWAAARRLVGADAAPGPVEAALTARADRLLAVAGDAWWPDCLRGLAGTAVEFRRGFVAAVRACRRRPSLGSRRSCSPPARWSGSNCSGPGRCRTPPAGCRRGRCAARMSARNCGRTCWRRSGSGTGGRPAWERSTGPPPRIGCPPRAWPTAGGPPARPRDASRRGL